MSSIYDGTTTYSFLTLRGGVQLAGERMAEITRPGSDGVAFQKVGQRTQPFVMVSRVDVDDAAAVATLITGYKTFEGELTTVTDDLGNAHTNVAVLRVELIRHYAVETLVGKLSTTGGFIVEARWFLQATETV